MIRKSMVAALLAGSALITSSPAFAQGDQPDTSDTTADAAIAAASPVDDAQAKIELLQAQVEALQDSIETLKTQVLAATPVWKGAPQFEDKENGFTFKPKGFAQFDAGFVGNPDGQEFEGTVGGLNYNNLGFNTRARRLVFGAEGTLPGSFGYKVEFNFAQATVDYEDVVLTYDFKNKPVQIMVGNFYPYSSLETVTSSRLGSMLERASFTDAFSYNRRLGIGVQLSDKNTDSYVVQAGVFSQPINDFVGSNSTTPNFNRTGWEASARGVYSPMMGDTRLHLGASVHKRVNQRDNQQGRYRTRPLTQVTDQRFIDTGAIAADGDTSAGIELAAIHKSLHMAAEAQKLWVDGYRPGETFGENNGTGGATFYEGDPSFTGGYFELGYYLTGETRAYKGGKWDRTKVLKPFNEGGWGAIQLNGRIDYVELRDRVGGSSLVAAPDYVNGGKQLGYQASLIWNPIDWVRFMAQYGHLDITGGPRAATVVPDSSNGVNKRKYSVDTAAIRAQIEF